jgi:hypothetical protein
MSGEEWDDAKGLGPILRLELGQVRRHSQDQQSTRRSRLLSEDIYYFDEVTGNLSAPSSTRFIPQVSMQSNRTLSPKSLSLDDDLDVSLERLLALRRLPDRDRGDAPVILTPMTEMLMIHRRHQQQNVKSSVPSSPGMAPVLRRRERDSLAPPQQSAVEILKFVGEEGSSRRSSTNSTSDAIHRT